MIYNFRLSNSYNFEKKPFLSFKSTSEGQQPMIMQTKQKRHFTNGDELEFSHLHNCNLKQTTLTDLLEHGD